MREKSYYILYWFCSYIFFPYHYLYSGWNIVYYYKNVFLKYRTTRNKKKWFIVEINWMRNTIHWKYYTMNSSILNFPVDFQKTIKKNHWVSQHDSGIYDTCNFKKDSKIVDHFFDTQIPRDYIILYIIIWIFHWHFS